MAYQTITVNIRERDFGGALPTFLTAQVYPLASNDGPPLPLVKDTGGNTILSGDLTVTATAAQLAAGLLPIVLPDPRDTTLAPTGFGYRVRVQTEYATHETLFGPAELDAYAAAGVLELEDVTTVGGVAFDAAVIYDAAGSAAAAQAFAIQRANHTGTQTASTISDFITAADARITAAKGAANGIAPLDGDARVPDGNLPARLQADVFATTYVRKRGDFDVRDYGTFTEASTAATNAATMQAANDAAYAAGGGRVVLPAGNYQCRGVVQDSRVEFYGPLTTLIHPDGLTGDIIAARERTTTGTISAASTSLTVASATGIEKGCLVGIRGAGGMSPLQFSTLTGAIDATQTTGITLASATGFANSGTLLVDSELINYTGVSSGTLTGVTRGAYGTTAAAHSSGANIGVAMRHIAAVTAVSGTTVTLDTAPSLGVTSAPVSVGAIFPVIRYLSFNGSRVNGGSASTLNPINWPLVRWGTIERIHIEDAESAFYLDKAAADNVISHVTARNCSVPEGSKGAVCWFFRQTCRNRLEDVAIYEGVWSGVYFDNRTSLATEWDGACNDNHVDGVRIKTPYLGSSFSNSGVLIVGGNRNKVSNASIAGVRTGFSVDNAAQVYTADASRPTAELNHFDNVAVVDSYQPFLLYTDKNRISGLTYNTVTNGTNSGTDNFITASAVTAGGPMIGARFADGVQAAPGMAFAAETNTGFYRIAAGQVQYVSQGTLGVRFTVNGIRFTDSASAQLLDVGATNGLRIGGGGAQKLGFYGTTPIIRPTSTPAAATDAATTQALVNDLRAKLLALGLIA